MKFSYKISPMFDDTSRDMPLYVLLCSEEEDSTSLRTVGACLSDYAAKHQRNS